MDINKLIQNIDLLSAQKGVNKTNALAECGAGKNFISNIMKGSDPSIAKVEQVADYYGVSIDYLLGRTTAPELSMQFQTTKEQQLIAAYKLLGIDEVTVYAAARSSSDQPPHKVKMSKAKIQKALADDSIKDDSDL